MNSIFRAAENYFEKLYLYLKSLNSELRVVLFSFFVGIIGGFGSLLFVKMIDWVFYLMVELPKSFNENLAPYITVFAPAIGGVIVGLIVSNFASEAKGHGVPEIISSVNLNEGKMRYRVPFVKIIASAVTIGSGGSTGREGPIAQIGGGFGSLLAEIFKLDPEERKILVISGVTAGISAIFNAPIGGILFGIEVIRRDRKAVNVLPLIVSSVVGTAISQIFLEDISSFVFPVNLEYSSHLNIPIFIIFGAIVGFFSIAWVIGFYGIENLFEKLPLPQPLVTGLGGLLVGIISLRYNIASAFTYSTINQVFALEFSLTVVLVLALVKFLATSFTLGSGGSGGIFAPTLYMGAMIGTAGGYILTSLGLSNIPIPVFTLLGMAALFAGSARAPLTGIIMMSEMVGDFKLFIPLMFAVVSAWIVSRSIHQWDIYIFKLRRRGVEFGSQEDILEEIDVKSIMTRDIVSVSPKDRIEHVLELMKETGHTGFPVVENGELLGIITEHDVDNILDRVDIKSWIVSEHCTKAVTTIVQDCPVSVAFLKMADLGINRFPVIDNKDSHNLVGWLTRSDVMRAYRTAKKMKAQQKQEEKLFEEIQSS